MQMGASRSPAPCAFEPCSRGVCLDKYRVIFEPEKNGTDVILNNDVDDDKVI